MGRKNHEYDPRGLIREAFAMEAVTAPECRAIFFDWALSRPNSPDVAAQIAALLELYGTASPDHPMAAILREGLPGMAQPRGRRGGRKRRIL